jgi:hypothetical protein
MDAGITNTDPRASDLERKPEKVFALQHKTSLRYLSAHPDLGVHAEDPDEANAVVWKSVAIAELYRLGLEPYAGAWEIVPVLRDPEAGRP